MTVEVDVTSPTAVTVDLTEGVTVGGLQAERNARIAGDAATLASAATDATTKANAAQAAAAIDATSKANAAQAAANAYADAGDAVLASTAGTTVGTATVNGDGTITPAFTTVWGVDSNGDPYYNAAGATSGEEAVLVVGVDGSLNIVKPGG